jgi:hypothetical protein
MKGPLSSVLIFLAIVAAALLATTTTTGIVAVDAFPGVVVLGRGSRHQQQQQQKHTTTTTITTTPSLLMSGGFLEGRIPKNDIRTREDDAMWVGDNDGDEGVGGWNPFQKKKVEKKSTTQDRGESNERIIQQINKARLSSSSSRASNEKYWRIHDAVGSIMITNGIARVMSTRGTTRSRKEEDQWEIICCPLKAGRTVSDSFLDQGSPHFRIAPLVLFLPRPFLTLSIPG